ncbi:MAG TPA: choice-of-anchor D domain-containing protein, partial [Alphaproteobacteria bacterium]|nr:choice-of-anchor D domain-containing protein [Alphaproteobacteria bacterium]
KRDIDVGETILNVTRRVTLFFVNRSSNALKIEKVVVNNDGNVQAAITNDDCTKQATITPGNRCDIEVSVTPISPGAWGAEVLVTHDGAGRLARARLSGKTSGTAEKKKDTGLTLSSKESPPVDFGKVVVGATAVRSALMVNDSPDAITLYSIDVIEADNGLKRLDQGCAVDMELKPGESCPVTLAWTPSEAGQISTDLIIRHSGRLGFAVIPLRGSTAGGAMAAASAATGAGKGSASAAPPSIADLEKAAVGKIPPVSAGELPAQPAAKTGGSMVLRLIGTIGNRAVLALPDGNTKVAAAGDDISLGDGSIKVVAVHARTADVLIDGKQKKTLDLGAAPELIAKAVSAQAAVDKKETRQSSYTTGSLGVPPSSTPLNGAPSAPSKAAVGTSP